MLRTVSHLALAGGLLLGTPLVASALVIDDFAAPLTTNAVVGLGGLPNPVNATGGGAAAGAIGGNRGVALERTAGGGTASVDVGLSTANALSVSTGAGVAANATVIYDGDTNGTPNTSGLGGIDVTDSGANSVLRLLVESDQAGVVFRITFHDGAVNTFLDLVTTGGNTFGSPQLLSGNLAALNQDILKNVGAITIDVFGPTSFDVSMKQFTTAVPEPGSLALVAIGLAGLRYAGSRRRVA